MRPTCPRAWTITPRQHPSSTRRERRPSAPCSRWVPPRCTHRRPRASGRSRRWRDRRGRRVRPGRCRRWSRCRCIGTELIMAASSASSPRGIRGVTIAPGAIAFTRMPVAAHSADIVFTRFIRPALAAPYEAWSAALWMPSTDATHTIEPLLPRRSRDRATSRAATKKYRRLRRWSRSQWSSDMSTIGPQVAAPTMVTRPWRSPSSRSVRSTASTRAASSSTSAVTARLRAPRSTRSAATRSAALVLGVEDRDSRADPGEDPRGALTHPLAAADHQHGLALEPEVGNGHRGAS